MMRAVLDLRAALMAVLLFAALTPAWAVGLSVTVSGRDGKPLADAVVAVYLKDVRASAGPGKSTEIAQRSRQFQPQVTVIQTGTSVLFPNFDTVRHHVYSFSAIQKFEIKLYAGVPNAPLTFDKPGVATLGCNIHDRMTAFVAVVDTPNFARTDAAGVASFDLPAGQHRLRSWHPSMPETSAWDDQMVSLGSAASRIAVSLPASADY